MLTSREYDEWSLKDHRDREYSTDAERRFFGAVDDPKPATADLKALVRDYGKYLKTQP